MSKPRKNTVAMAEPSSTVAKPKKVGGATSAAEEGAAPHPKMDLCQRIHSLTYQKRDHHDNLSSDHLELQAEVFEEIATDLENPAMYRQLQETLYDGTMSNIAACKLTPQELADMQDKNSVKEKELLSAIDEAVESAGDMEVLDARIELARFAAKSLDQAATLAAYQAVLDLPKLSSGKKIDALMESARVASFYGDTAAADDFIDRADKLANAGGGGDWDRRNRLKVYKALQRLLHRDLQTASTLLLDCIATFSCNEICSYNEFCVYAIMTNMLHLPRPDLKEKILDGPEILGVAAEIPVVVSPNESFRSVTMSLFVERAWSLTVESSLSRLRAPSDQTRPILLRL